MLDCPTFKYLVLIFIMGWFASVAKADEALNSNGGMEVEIKHDQFSTYLSDLGLSSEDLNWGASCGGVKMAALLMRPKDPRSIALGQTTLVFSIYNQSSTPLIIPLLGDFPAIAYYASETSPKKRLYKRHPGMTGAIPDVMTLESGKMITFTLTDKFDWFNKELVPMTISFDFDNLGVLDVPETEKDLILESNEVKFPSQGGSP
jgi:hypothetical protein